MKKKKIKLMDIKSKRWNKMAGMNCDTKCDKCPFQVVMCGTPSYSPNCWIHHKDMFSDKFLDQEIEVEE